MISATPQSNRLTPYQQSVADVLAALETDAQSGLSQAQAQERLTRYGGNELAGEKPMPAWLKFLAQFKDALVVRIGHLDLLHPGLPCVLTLPPSLGPLVLTGSIVHSRVAGVHNDSTGARYPHYESGIEFIDVTPDRQTVLTDVLTRLTLEGTENGRLQVEGNEAPDSGMVGVS